MITHLPGFVSCKRLKTDYYPPYCKKHLDSLTLNINININIIVCTAIRHHQYEQQRVSLIGVLMRKSAMITSFPSFIILVCLIHFGKDLYFYIPLCLDLDNECIVA